MDDAVTGLGGGGAADAGRAARGARRRGRRGSVYGANDEAVEDARAAAIGRAAGVLVNIVDNLEDSAFITPAIVDRDPVTVAIGTEGAAPVLARKIKAEIEEMLPAALGALDPNRPGVPRPGRGARFEGAARRSGRGSTSSAARARSRPARTRRARRSSGCSPRARRRARASCTSSARAPAIRSS